MNKKLSWATMIIIIILSLCVGVGAGMLISNNINKNKIAKDATQETKQQEEKVIQANTTENKENSISSETEETKYDGTKSITINGKEYKISYLAEYYELDQEYPITISLYFNDKKIRSIDIPYMMYVNEEEPEELRKDTFNKEYEVKLHNIKNEYILVEITNRNIGGMEDKSATLCVLNLKGEFIGTKRWQSRYEGVSLKSNNKSLNRYEIYDDGFLIFTASELLEEEYTINSNKIEVKNYKHYQEDEVIRAGK